LTIAFVTGIATVTWFSLVAAIYGQRNPCVVYVITIEICPYKDPCHCTNLLVTLITLWLLYRLTLVSETDCVRHLPGSWPILPHWQSWEHSQGHSLQLCCHGNSHALDGTCRWL